MMTANEVKQDQELLDVLCDLYKEEIREHVAKGENKFKFSGYIPLDVETGRKLAKELGCSIKVRTYEGYLSGNSIDVTMGTERPNYRFVERRRSGSNILSFVTDPEEDMITLLEQAQC